MEKVTLPTAELILAFHDFVLSSSGGRPGVRDKNVIEGAIQRPQTYMQYADCSIHTICALLLDSLSRNHAFIEGNKRTSLITIAMTYAMNGINIEYDQTANDEYESLVLDVVTKRPGIPEIATRLEKLWSEHKANSAKIFVEKLFGFFLNREFKL